MEKRTPIYALGERGRKRKSEPWSQDEKSALFEEWLTGQKLSGRFNDRTEAAKTQMRHRLMRDCLEGKYKLQFGTPQASPVGTVDPSSQRDPQIMIPDATWPNDLDRPVVAWAGDSALDQAWHGQSIGVPAGQTSQLSCASCLTHDFSKHGWHAPWCFRGTGHPDLAVQSRSPATGSWTREAEMDSFSMTRLGGGWVHHEHGHTSHQHTVPRG